MDLIVWIGRLLFFLLALWFALENTGGVQVRLSSGLVWPDVPLVAVILACFAAGVLAGTIALAPLLFRLRRQLAVKSRAARPAPAATETGERLAEAARRLGAVGGLDADNRLDR
jgi:uncharacterized integral membrane protein